MLTDIEGFITAFIRSAVDISPCASSRSWRGRRYRPPTLQRQDLSETPNLMFFLGSMTLDLFPRASAVETCDRRP